jgi:excisionase family DNA binding protein
VGRLRFTSTDGWSARRSAWCDTSLDEVLLMPGDTRVTTPRPTAPALGPVLTVAEVAEALRVSTMTVYRLVSTGELSGLRVGKNIRIRATDLDAYLAAGSVAADRPNG